MDILGVWLTATSFGGFADGRPAQAIPEPTATAATAAAEELPSRHRRPNSRVHAVAVSLPVAGRCPGLVADEANVGQGAVTRTR